MPRRKILTDEDVLDSALALVHERGPDALTFASLSEACGLSSATLVQRFKSKPGLMQSALLHAWDGLAERTARLSAAAPRSPRGAVALLVALSADYGGIESYAEGLLVLREDIRDPVLRARAAAWKAQLSAALDRCFAGIASAPAGVGLMLASQWQGAVLWWSFDPRGSIERYVEDSLERFVSAVLGPGPGGS